MAYFSIYKGYVVDRKDPDKSGRLMLKVPSIWGAEQVHEYWAYPKGLFSGNGIGFIAIPEVGDMVWVQFEGGNPIYPVWDYGHWLAEGVIDQVYDEDGEPSKLVLKSKSGHIISIDDRENILEVKHASGPTVKLDSTHISLIADGTKAISFGKDGESAEPAVLGDQNETILNGLTDAFNTLVQALTEDIVASTGQTFLLLPTQTASAVIQILSDLSALKAQIAQTKSKKVTLD